MKVSVLCLCLMILSVVGCAKYGTPYRIKATGEKVIYESTEDHFFKTIRVLYLGNDNQTYYKVVKEEEIIPESEYVKLHSDEWEYQRLKKKLGK